MIKLVSDNKEIAAEKARLEREARETDAMAAVEVAIKRLAANLMRIAGDGGKSYEVLGQVSELVKAVVELEKIDPTLVKLAIERGLEVRRTNPDSLFLTPEETIVQASLRVYASLLLGQTTQVSNADTALYKAIERYNEGRRRR